MPIPETGNASSCIARIALIVSVVTRLIDFVWINANPEFLLVRYMFVQEHVFLSEVD